MRAVAGVLLALVCWAAAYAGDSEDDGTATTQASPESAPPAPLRRRELELSARDNPYAISPHRPNYLLPLSYSHRPDGRDLGVSRDELDEVEIKFQLSFKVAAWRDPLGLPADLYFAYTGRSFWQAYNSQQSSPFRDTNHEPEFFLATHRDWTLGPLNNVNLRLGISHQSNGQALPLSRSWNRVYLGTTGRWQRFFFDAVLWKRIPEDAKDGPSDPEGDDNPDIERTVGQGEFSLAWVTGNKSVRVTLRNNLRHDNKGALTTAFTFPLANKLRGYAEFFSGYGETLIDYDRSNERISLGIALSDWP